MFLKVIWYRITGEKMCTEKCDLIRNVNLVDVDVFGEFGKHLYIKIFPQN